jgi:peroxiredoxin
MLPAVRRPAAATILLLFAILAHPEAIPWAGAESAWATERGPAPAARAPRSPQERPLPAFRGVTLDGNRVSSTSLLGRRLLLFFFNPDVPEASVAAGALAAVSNLAAKHNFDVVGIGTAASRPQLEAFVEEQGLDFQVIDDSRGEIVRRVRIREPVTMLGVDPEGYVVFALAGIPLDVPDPGGLVESSLRAALRLPVLGNSLAPVLGEKPLAPDFSAERLQGGAPFESKSLRGRPAVLIFFLHVCPHCHHALRALKKELAALPAEHRPALIGISASNRAYAVRQILSDEGLDFFPVLLDADTKIRSAYGAVETVPDIFLIDAEGRVVARVQGWDEERDPPLMRMRLAQLAGQAIPMLLHHSGYSGNAFCGVCHQAEYATWQLTPHSLAFDTLVRHGAERDSECVSCHVVGWQQPGGY